MKEYDLFVIGGGSGGVSAARTAASLGAKVGIAESLDLGGTCVNKGCVPKKLYNYAASFNTDFKNAKNFGWNLEKPLFDWQTLKNNVFAEVRRLNKIYKDKLNTNNVDIFNEFAHFIDKNHIQVGNQTIRANKILISTGSSPFVPPIKGKEHAIVSDEAFHLNNLPEKIAIVGGGYIAVEFASIFNALGVEVHLLVRKQSLLRQFDSDIRNFVEESIKNQGVKIHCGVNINEIKQDKSDYILFKDDSNIPYLKVSKIMFATGRKPNIKNLKIENANIELSNDGAIKIDEEFRTTTENIFAVGDVTNKFNLTPVAIAQSRTFVFNEFELPKLHRKTSKKILDYANIPTAIFSIPPISSVGLTENKAKDEGYNIDVYTTKFRPMKYSLGDIDDKLYMKMIVDSSTNKVLGIHIVGLDGPEMLQGFASGIKSGITKETLDNTIGIHPSSAEELLTLRTPRD